MKYSILSLLLIWCVITTGFAAQRLHLQVYSKSMGHNVPVIVIQPDQVTEKALPAIYILHGYSGNPERTLAADIPGLENRADHEQILFVLPDGAFSSWYADSPLRPDSRYESFIGTELVSYIDGHFPTIRSRAGRGLLGWSMGGYGTLMIGSQHGDTFGILGSICGVIDFRPFIKLYGVDRILGNDGLLWEKYVLFNRLSDFKSARQQLILDCGTGDALIGQNREFHRLLLENGVKHIFIEQPGTHDITYWAAAAQLQLDCFNRYFKAGK